MSRHLRRLSIFDRYSAWRLKWNACGLFDKDYEGDVPIVKLITHEVEEEQIEGQMDISMLLGEGE